MSINSDENGNARAVLYLRVSTKEQAKKGGESEGYSIPAQREACLRKAETLGASVIEEFVDAGESARSADRPQLQRMLAYLEAESVQFVIVHKVDRLARNRLDDVMISLALERAGVTLVSCSEAIDESPSGKLTHGLMALIAEWYSSNLSHEVKTKVLQKVRNGGTAGKAPIGYLNVRKIENGREIRTVAVDEHRAPLVQWAFEAYATGSWSLTRLTEALSDRGLTSVATAHFPEKLLARATVHRTLRNAYYIGIVTWQGVEYQGNHPPLISRELFERVQEVLDAHNIAGEKQRIHHHYLKGSVWCGSCGSRLIVTKTTNRHGSRYEYFICIGRQQKRTACTQSAIPIEIVERQVEEKWRGVQVAPAYAELLDEFLTQEIGKQRAQTKRDRNIATRRIQVLLGQRQKLLDAHYAEAIPIDLLKAEQDRTTRELTATRRLLAASEVTFETIEEALRRCLAFLMDCHGAYVDAPQQERRHMNQAVFRRFLVSDDGKTDAEPTGAFGFLLAPDLVVHNESSRRATHSRLIEVVHRARDWRDGFPASLYESMHALTGKPRPVLAGLGLNAVYLVPPAGFEPALQP